MRVGLFFGSFNPVHMGHMVLANYMLEFTDLERIWFVVTPHNPHKKKTSLLDERQRLHMVNLAIGDNDRLAASDIEFKLPQPSYTVDTLAYLQDKYPQHEFALMMGEDNLKSLPKWKNYEVILKNHHIYVYPRPGVNSEALRNHDKITFTDAPFVEVSSTQIRKAVKAKKDMRYFMPLSAWNYLMEMHFYEQ